MGLLWKTPHNQYTIYNIHCQLLTIYNIYGIVKAQKCTKGHDKMTTQKPACMIITTPDQHSIYLGMHSLCTDQPHPHPFSWVTRKAQKYANAFTSCTVTIKTADGETVITPNNEPAKITGADMITLGLYLQAADDADPYSVDDFYDSIGALIYDDDTGFASLNFPALLNWYRNTLENDPELFIDELPYFIDLYDDGDPAKDWRIMLLNAVRNYAERKA